MDSNSSAPRITTYVDAPVEILPHDPVYEAVAGVLARRIESAATGAIVEHVGSTAVAGCAGKGIIDLMVLYPKGMIAQTRAALDALGFQRQGGPDSFPESRPMRVGAIAFAGRSFRVHAHVIALGSAEHSDMIAFRELLRANPDARAQYEAAKRSIVARGIREGVAYAREKSATVERLSRA